MSDKLRVNGNLVNWSSAYLKIGGEQYSGISDVSYGDKRTRSKGYGMGRAYGPRGRTSGKYEPDEVKLVMFKDSAEEVRKALAAQAADGRSYGNVEFMIVLQFVEGENTPQNIQMLRCVIVGDTSSVSESPDPLKDEFTIDTMEIVRNGRSLRDATEG